MTEKQVKAAQKAKEKAEDKAEANSLSHISFKHFRNVRSVRIQKMTEKINDKKDSFWHY